MPRPADHRAKHCRRDVSTEDGVVQTAKLRNRRHLFQPSSLLPSSSSPQLSHRRRVNLISVMLLLTLATAIAMVVMLVRGISPNDLAVLYGGAQGEEEDRSLLPDDAGLCDSLTTDARGGCETRLARTVAGNAWVGGGVLSTARRESEASRDAENIRRVQSVSSVQPMFFPHAMKEVVLDTVEEALHTSIQSHCETIRSTILSGWLPQARRDGDGVHRVHLAFVGESHARKMRRSVLEDIKVCVPGSLTESNALCEVPFSRYCAATVFEPELTGLEDPPIQPGTQLVLSIHQLPYAKNLVQTLANAYLPLFQNASEEKRRGDYAALFQPSISLNLKPTVRATEAADVGRPRPGTWLSPSLSLRAPDILYLNTGSWDIVHAEPVWSDYEVYSHDVYMRPDFGTYLPTLVERLVTSLRANYSLPMQALLRVLSDAWEEDRFKSGDIHPETQAFMPPRKVVLSTPPKFNCDGRAHRVRIMDSRKFDYRRYLLGPERCTSIVYPLEEAVGHSLRDVQQQLKEEQQGRNVPSSHPPEKVFLSWAESDNRCLCSDSIHLDHNTPSCRDYIIRHFYGHV